MKKNTRLMWWLCAICFVLFLISRFFVDLNGDFISIPHGVSRVVDVILFCATLGLAAALYLYDAKHRLIVVVGVLVVISFLFP
jgi:hypothetical protein